MKYNIMGQQFNLEDWIKNKNRKVITRKGKSVRIICWDSPCETFPIVGFIEGEFTPKTWDSFGYFLDGHTESNDDLLFADDEKVNTEIPKWIKVDTEVYDEDGSVPRTYVINKIPLGKTYVEYGGYKICLDELYEKLPKEK